MGCIFFSGNCSCTCTITNTYKVRNNCKGKQIMHISDHIKSCTHFLYNVYLYGESLGFRRSVWGAVLQARRNLLAIAVHHAAKTHRALTVRRQGAHLPAVGRSPAKILSVAIARFGTSMVSKSNLFIIHNSHRQFLATNIVIIWQQLSHPKSALVLVEGAPRHTKTFTWRPP